MNTSCSLPADLSTDERCALVQEYSSACEGGGYIAYTALVTCQAPVAKAWVLIAIILWMFFLFLSVSVAADEFFTHNISAIVNHLKISENIAVSTVKTISIAYLAYWNVLDWQQSNVFFQYQKKVIIQKPILMRLIAWHVEVLLEKVLSQTDSWSRFGGSLIKYRSTCKKNVQI